LTKQQAYEGIVHLVAEQPQQMMSAACQRQLTEHQARALVGWADHGQEDARVDTLQQALRAANTIAHQDLVAWVTTRLDNVAQQRQLAAQQQALTEQQHVIATQQRDLVHQQHLIAAQQHELTDLKASLTTLLLARLGEITGVQETAAGELTVQLPDTAIRFESGQARLTPAALETMRKIVALLNQETFKRRRIRVEGHADATGSALENQLLSEARAQQVAQALEDAGISKERLRTVGHGHQHPLGPNDTTAGRQQNRRVEIIIEP
jgi:OmpA-OmpF porin, OOP family